MKKRFKAEVLPGHKQKAAEVPFDPADAWNVQPQWLWRGRRGFCVRARINGISFESAIVSRQRKFFLLIDDDLTKSAALREGELARVTIEPVDAT